MYSLSGFSFKVSPWNGQLDYDAPLFQGPQSPAKMLKLGWALRRDRAPSTNVASGLFRPCVMCEVGWVLVLLRMPQGFLSGYFGFINSSTLPQSKGKNSLVSGFDAAFLPNVFRVFEKLWAMFNADKKLFTTQYKLI